MSNEVKSVCPVCGRKFVKRAVNQKYCCIKCKRAAAKAENITLKKGDQFKSTNGKKFVCVKGGKKAVVKKVVKGKAVEKINLPKPPTFKEVKPEIVQVVRKHTINPGDIITWSGFTPERILKYAIHLAAIAVIELDKASKKPAKKGK